MRSSNVGQLPVVLRRRMGRFESFWKQTCRWVILCGYDGVVASMVVTDDGNIIPSRRYDTTFCVGNTGSGKRTVSDGRWKCYNIRVIDVTVRV